MSDMDGEDGMGEEGNRHRDFLVSMTSLSSGRDGEKSSGVEGGDGSSTDARFKLSHGNDDCPITEGQALSDLLGEAVTIDSLLKTAKEAAGDSTTSKDVAKTLRSSYQATIGKNKGLRLEAPASSVQEAKIGRLATHKKFTQQMTKWDAAVHSRRAATQVSYPLVKPDLSLKGAKDSAIAFKNQTPLEIEVAKLLYGSKVNQQTTDESGNSVGLSVREMREKLNDLAKIRAHEAYQQAKLKRQNKIKSKKYRRQLRKERKKELEAKDGATDDKKEEADLARAQERASLKHTKASKSLHFVAKHKDNSGVKNQILAEKDRKKRELKAKEDPSSSEEEEGETEAGGADSGDEVHVNLNGDQVAGAAPTSGSVEEAAREAKLLEMVQANAEKKKAEAAAVAQKNLNPDDFMQVNVKSQNFADADSSDEGDDFEGEEGVTDSRTKIAEAFANDDDILRDFKKEAQEKAKAKRALNKRPADMPGWGSWAGSDADMKKKRKRTRNKHRDALAEKAGKKPKESSGQGSSGYRVIVNEGARGPKAREHQASTVPFPFTGVSDFEASIRMPLGETFVPRTSFKKLTKPKVKVAKGAVIDPVDKSELVRRGIVKFNDLQEVDVDCGMF